MNKWSQIVYYYYQCTVIIYCIIGILNLLFYIFHRNMILMTVKDHIDLHSKMYS